MLDIQRPGTQSIERSIARSIKAIRSEQRRTSEIIPALPNWFERHVMLYDAANGGRHFEPSR
jgi:hypothetical protein